MAEPGATFSVQRRSSALNGRIGRQAELIELTHGLLAHHAGGGEPFRGLMDRGQDPAA
jgi:hypothetical protein